MPTDEELKGLDDSDIQNLDNDDDDDDDDDDNEDEDEDEDDDDDEDEDEDDDEDDDDDDLDEEIAYRTYKMDFVHKRIGGMIDEKDACMQAIWKALSTVRFANLIYDDQYGCDVFNKINDAGLTPDFLDADMPAMVEDALLNDDRILSIHDFTYNIVARDGVEVNFIADTIYGDLEVEGVINNGD